MGEVVVNKRKMLLHGVHGAIWWILMGHLSKLDISIWVRFNGLPRKNLFICLPSPNILSNSSRQRLSRPLCIFELEPTSPSPSPYHEWNNIVTFYYLTWWEGVLSPFRTTAINYAFQQTLHKCLPSPYRPALVVMKHSLRSHLAWVNVSFWN